MKIIKLTKEELAARLTGRPYGDEITRFEEDIATESGLVVVFGYSDDNMEICGALGSDEFGCYNGGEFIVTKKGVFDAEGWGTETDMADGPTGWKLDALWCKEPGYSFTYKTVIPHATFEITENGEPYCRGIVFSIADL